MQQGKDIQHVFLIGAKSLGAYGGYETFVDKLTEYHQHDARIKYHVACKANGDGCMDETRFKGIDDVVKKSSATVEFTYHNARCFKIKIPERLGAAQAIYYDVKALNESCRYIKKNKIAINFATLFLIFFIKILCKYLVKFFSVNFLSF